MTPPFPGFAPRTAKAPLPVRRRLGVSRWLAGVLTFLLAACGGEEATGPSLWTAELAPEVLVEEGRVTVPVGAPLGDEVGATRFLAGWVPWRHEGQPVLGAGRDGARVQVVHLADRPRTLHLDLLGEAAAEGDGLSVRVSPVGRPPSWTEVEDVDWGDPVEIPLPAGLPPGRLLVEVGRELGAPPLDVSAARLRPNLPAGEVHFAEGDLVQGGWSRVEAVRRVRPGEAIHGTFRPPDDAGDGQVFRAVVQDARGARVADFEWRQGQLGWSQPVRLPTGEESGLVRLVFTAEGAGPPATWEGFRWRDERPVGPSLPAKRAERREAGGLGDEAPRLVMVYVMDALRADHVAGLRDPEAAARPTPFDPARHPQASATFDRLGGEGVVFTRHRSVAPSTLPSTRALFTGRLQPEAADAGEAVLLAEHFRDAGYRTALFSGNPYVGPAYGLDRGFDHVAEGVLYEEADGADDGTTFNDNAARVHAAALEWLETLPDGERAFVYLHTIHPHNPYAPPREVARPFTRGIASRIDGSTDTLFAIQRRRRDVDGADRARLAALYHGAFAYNDRELASFLDAAADLVAPEDTLLALTSDHGEELFDHGGVLHGYTLYEEQLSIPLVLWAPGRLEPGRVATPTTTLDLRVTLLGLLGALGPDARSPENTLATPGLLAEAPATPRPLLAAAPSVREGQVALRLGDAKLIVAPGGPRTWGMGLGRGRSRDAEYFFDLGRDPGERRNLVGLGGIEEDLLRAWVRGWTRGRGGGGTQDVAVDEETRKRLEALGYLR